MGHVDHQARAGSRPGQGEHAEREPGPDPEPEAADPLERPEERHLPERREPGHVHRVPVVGRVEALETMNWHVDVERVLRILEAIPGDSRP